MTEWDLLGLQDTAQSRTEEADQEMVVIEVSKEESQERWVVETSIKGLPTMTQEITEKEKRETIEITGHLRITEVVEVK